VPFPLPQSWEHDTADVRRDEQKRIASPCSFFFSQGQSLVLAAKYFSDDKLTDQAKRGVATKHRHRISLAMYGQLLASFEYMLKDFIARVLDSVTSYDDEIRKAKWIEVDTSRVLALRHGAATPGALLIHPTLGWHYPEEVNRRFAALFQASPIDTAEIETLEKLWVLRHSVAHNAGYVIAVDASRLGSAVLREKVADIDPEFVEQTFDFLSIIADRLATVVGGKILSRWLRERRDLGPDFNRDEVTYRSLKALATYVKSRPKALPNAGAVAYRHDIAALGPP
jgi:hypothetical protein